MDESAVLAALSTLTAPDGAPLVGPDELAGVMSELGWICVMLRTERANGTEFLARVHAHLVRAFPDTEVEVRVDRRIYRGGEGFGDGRHNLGIMSVGFAVPERRPMALTGRWLVSSMLRNLLLDMAWTADVLLIDAPPGTGEEIQVMARELPLSRAIFVTTPQDLAQMDAERTFALLREQGVMVIGLVQNMSSLTCPHCDREIDLFGHSSRLADAGVNVLGRIPFDVRMSVNADRGLPLVLGDPRGPIAYEFARIGTRVRAWLRGRGGLRAER